MQHVKRSRHIMLICLVLVAVTAFLTLAVLRVTHTAFFHKTPPVTASPNTKGVGTTPRQTKTPVSDSTTPPPNDNKGNAIAPAALVAPSGNFVSNHHPNLSGSPAPNTLVSVCNTSAGAVCIISFTNVESNTVQSLPSQTTDQGGSTYWDWNLQNIGLTVGTWKVTARATLGDQVLSATDAMNLEVTQ